MGGRSLLMRVVCHLATNLPGNPSPPPPTRHQPEGAAQIKHCCIISRDIFLHGFSFVKTRKSTANWKPSCPMATYNTPLIVFMNLWSSLYIMQNSIFIHQPSTEMFAQNLYFVYLCNIYIHPQSRVAPVYGAENTFYLYCPDTSLWNIEFSLVLGDLRMRILYTTSPPTSPLPSPPESTNQLPYPLRKG